jgi:hypothetical protein
MSKQEMEALDLLEIQINALPSHVAGKSTDKVVSSLSDFLRVMRLQKSGEAQTARIWVPDPNDDIPYAPLGSGWEWGGNIKIVRPDNTVDVSNPLFLYNYEYGYDLIVVGPGNFVGNFAGVLLGELGGEINDMATLLMLAEGVYEYHYGEFEYSPFIIRVPYPKYPYRLVAELLVRMILSTTIPGTIITLYYDIYTQRDRIMEGDTETLLALTCEVAVALGVTFNAVPNDVARGAISDDEVLEIVQAQKPARVQEILNELGIDDIFDINSEQVSTLSTADKQLIRDYLDFEIERLSGLTPEQAALLPETSTGSIPSDEIYEGPTAPLNPEEGQLWRRTTDNALLKYYEGAGWGKVPGSTIPITLSDETIINVDASGFGNGRCHQFAVAFDEAVGETAAKGSVRPPEGGTLTRNEVPIASQNYAHEFVEYQSKIYDNFSNIYEALTYDEYKGVIKATNGEPIWTDPE